LIAEALAWLQVRCGSSARALGYRREAAALRVKARRCRAAWHDHLRSTRDALAASARLATVDARGGDALVLGPGMLADVPLDGLLERFDRVLLVDIASHPEARAAARRSGGRVECVDHDLTGVVARIAKAARVIPAAACTLDAIRPPALRWVASVNILSQLPLLPCARLYHAGADGNAVHELASKIFGGHVHALATCGVPVALIAEARDITVDRHGARIEDEDHWPTLASALGDVRRHELARWTWHLHPPGELAGGRAGAREMVALHLHPAID